MSTKMLNKIEKVLKAEAKTTNRQRASRRREYLKNGGDVDNADKVYKPIKWTKALALDWQVRNQVFKGHSGKAVFDPVAMTATSYAWWIFVRRIKGKVVFNDYGYSHTTKGHQGSVSRVMRDLGIKIDLEVSTHASLSDFETAVLPALYNDLFTLEIAQARRNAKDRTSDINEVKRKIVAAKKLGAKIDAERMAGIKADCMKTETDRLVRQRAERAKVKTVKYDDRKLVETNRVVDLSVLR